MLSSTRLWEIFSSIHLRLITSEGNCKFGWNLSGILWLSWLFSIFIKVIGCVLDKVKYGTFCHSHSKVNTPIWLEFELIRNMLPVGWVYWWFTALRHILGHFGRSQLTKLHCSWASLLGSLLVHSTHFFANNWQLPFLNQLDNGRRNFFMTKSQKNVLPEVAGRRASDPAAAPSKFCLSWLPASIWKKVHTSWPLFPPIMSGGPFDCPMTATIVWIVCLEILSSLSPNPLILQDRQTGFGHITMSGQRGTTPPNPLPQGGLLY